MAKKLLILFQLILILIVFVIKTKSFVYEAPSRCSNPNGRIGTCVSVYDCQTILNVIKTQTPDAFAFARQSECPTNDQGRPPYVCCTSDSGFKTRNNRIVFPHDFDDNEEEGSLDNISTTWRTPKEINRTSIYPLFPRPPVCGPVTIGNKIYGGQETQLGEFPWLANLEYKKRNGDLVTVCAGNIINQRYILTAAHCVKGDIEIKIGKLVSVRVGVHNIETPVDCNNTGCLDVFQRMSVAKVVVHAGYGCQDSYHNHNDIALIKTDRNIQYSFSVAPVCLPDVSTQMAKLRNGMRLYVAGWGHTGTRKFSAVKRKVEVPYVENDECPLKVAPEQLCAGGEFGRDSCTGDSGGGLVRIVGDAWILEGIVSYGRGCGLERPGAYTRVRSYISWIHDNVHN